MDWKPVDDVDTMVTQQNWEQPVRAMGRNE